ncbi:MAG TPA: class I SAM-dependent methyltransferase [Anaerolineales bacterium]|nr:class I SAM-dependent methyltransferase [Anaerolineales bacterium]
MKSMDINRAHWDEVAPVHLKAYRVATLLSGVSLIDTIQKRELYPVQGKQLLHLQCHIGTDTLSLALDGAKVTGVDFSPRSIQIATELAQKMNLPAKFIVADVLNLPKGVLGTYDIVYTSMGVLCWINDIDKWAWSISSHLKSGGTFYIFETHPTLLMFDDTKSRSFEVRYPYFHRNAPIHFDDDHPDYADTSYIPKNKTYEWQWSLSDVVNALIQQGLTIEFLNEHDQCFFQGLPGMTQTSDGWWTLAGCEGTLPMAFSLRARK